MTKNIIFIFAALCTLQARAAVQSPERDTVRCTSLYEDMELFQPLQPSYLDGVIVPTRGSGNWFVSVAGGATAFLGTPLGCEDLFGRLKPSYSLAIGKWFTPSVGARINYSGLQFKDGILAVQEYHHLHADLLWNVLGGSYARQERVRWHLSPFAGVGLLHNATNGRNPFAISYGIQGQYRISKRVSALVELSGTTTFQDLDGYGRANRLGDHLLSLSVGFSFHLGKVGWKCASDVTHYVHRNEQLVDYAHALSEENNRYAGLYDRNRRTFVELEKILGNEGLLDTYGYLFNGDTVAHSDYSSNNYSGLNSLRARLRNRKWDGKSPFEEEPSNRNVSTDTLSNKKSSMSETGELHNPSNCISTGKATFIQSGKDCIGSPVLFFFELGTSRLTDSSQLVNLDELARVAKEYGLYVTVIGAADNATGTAPTNKTLSTLRANYIATELEQRGISTDNITTVYGGGISIYTPNAANRHTKVMLHFK